MKRSALDVGVGVFVILGILALGWLSIRLGKVELWGGQNYTVTADFPSAGGLNQARRDQGPLALASKIWSRLPRPVARWGSGLFRYLG